MKLPTPSHGPQLFKKKKTHPVCDAKKCKCAVAPFFFFLERAYFMDITQQKSTTYQRPAWYGVYDLKKCFLSMYELTRSPGLRSTSRKYNKHA